MAPAGGASKAAAARVATRPRPAGPSATFSDISGGNGVFLGDPIPVNLERAGYVEHEYVASGTATSYTATSPLAKDGRWSFAPDGTAPYRTRVLVRRPRDRARFSGRVVVEWLNVSGGVDADPEWSTTHEEILRRGDAWVGVSAQRIGVEGGPVLVRVDVPGSEAAGQGLKTIDPARYGSLQQPGDGFAFDIYTQVARAVRSGAGMGGSRPKRIIAAGESQSAFALVTYYNGVQPITDAFDGFFVHSRGGGGLPLVGPGEYAGIANAIGGTPTTFRTDQDAPVLDVQTESDLTSVINSYPARQPDSGRFRLWEVPGTAHADAHLLGSTAQYIQCGVPINNGALHVVAKAGLRALTTWIETGKAPPKAPRIDVAAGPPPQIQRNADGIAQGGIRTPPVDVPVAALSGAPGPNPSTICLLLGSTNPIPAERLAQLYPSRAAYKKQFDRAADAAIKAGFVLPEDRAALLAFADPTPIQG
ncbi:MAG TPA: alpha/beta hydrolase domain-containing protein [Acidimicrobiia bacterium]|nr:alpha/beta hydrolase domain-containing protein [Acidimicrobiia bacterium]